MFDSEFSDILFFRRSCTVGTGLGSPCFRRRSPKLRSSARDGGTIGSWRRVERSPSFVDGTEVDRTDARNGETTGVRVTGNSKQVAGAPLPAPHRDCQVTLKGHAASP